MKDRISDTARVLVVRGQRARVRLTGGGTCKRCGLAAMGMCRPGGTGQEYDVENPVSARAGDTVRLTLDPRVHLKGYALAYIVPLGVFLLGSLMGYAASGYLGIANLDVAGGFAGFALAAWLTLRGLRRLSKGKSMVIASVVHDVPDFHPEEAAMGGEGLNYLAYMRISDNCK